MEKLKLNPQLTWWWWAPVQDRLRKWTLAMLHGARYSILLSPEGTGYHDRENRTIQANPQAFPKRSPELQFRATQGILAHEVGHHYFTGCWQFEQKHRLRELANILEDHRIERAMTIAWPGVEEVILTLRRLMLSEVRPVDRGGSPSEIAYGLILTWRFAERWVDHERFLRKLNVPIAARETWSRIKPLVEEAWTASDTARVIQIAEQILKILGIPPDAPARNLAGVSVRGIPADKSDEDEGEPMEMPTGPLDTDMPGKGRGVEDDAERTVVLDDYSYPAPYGELERKAQPLVNQLVQALRLPEPDVHPEAHEWRGRYNTRQDLRTPETPNLVANQRGLTPRSLAVYLLADRSGSMRSIMEPMQLAMMSLYLAATELAIPTGIAYFGASSDSTAENLTCEITPCKPQATEEAKAMIAGYSGETGAEFLNWGLTLAEKNLLARPETKKVMLVLTDGQPVYKGELGIDWDLSHAHIRQLERRGITVIGLYLGNDRGDMLKLSLLFPRLIVTRGDKVAEKLGQILKNLA